MIRSILRPSRAILLVAVLGGCSGETQAAPPARSESPPPIASLAACDLPPDSIRFLVVLDHSGSMRPDWQDVRQSLAGIVDALPAGSWFQLDVFSDHSRTAIPDFRVTDAERATLRRLLATIDTPSIRAPTDIGEALYRTANDIEQARKQARGRLTFLFFVTDGKHEPPPGSAYPDPVGTWVPPLWKRWNKLAQGSDLQLLPYAVAIGAQGAQGAQGGALVGQIVTYVSHVQGQPDRFGRVISKEIAHAVGDLRRSRAKPEVEQPRLVLEPLAAAQPVGLGGGEVEARVRSTAACVTYSLSTTTPANRSAAAPPPPLLLGPGDTARVRLAASGRHGWWQLLPWSAPRVNSLRLPHDRTLGFEPDSELVRLAIPHAPRPAALATISAIEYQPVGWGRWLSVVLSILGVSVLSYSWRFRVRLSGRIPSEKLVNEKKEQVETLDDLGRRTHLLTLSHGLEVKLIARKAKPWGRPYDDSYVVAKGRQGARVTPSAKQVYESFRKGPKKVEFTVKGADSEEKFTWEPDVGGANHHTSTANSRPEHVER